MGRIYEFGTDPDMQRRERDELLRDPEVAAEHERFRAEFVKRATDAGFRFLSDEPIEDEVVDKDKKE